MNQSIVSTKYHLSIYQVTDKKYIIIIMMKILIGNIKQGLEILA